MQNQHQTQTETGSGFILVQPVEPAAPYMGGKRLLAKTIIRRIADIPHKTYVEPFVGMGGVFLRRPFQAPQEVINDFNGDVANFFRILQRHYNAFVDILRWQVTARSTFETLSKTDPTTLTDLERAARFFYLQSVAFGGKISGRNFGVAINRPSRFNINKVAAKLDELQARLAGVIIENLPWQDILKRYDSTETLFYIDPPYYGSERVYGRIFERKDFTVMATLLANIKGKFIVSLNDKPEVRKIFSGFTIDKVATTYSINHETPKQAGEILISNRTEQ